MANLPALTESQERQVWSRVFGFKIGQIVRPKYGKCYWEIYAYFPKWNLIKVRRLRRDKYGTYRAEEVATTFYGWQICEVYPEESKESLGIPFPSKVFR